MSTGCVMMGAAASRTLNRRGEAFAAIGNYDSAIADFNTALLLDQNNAEANDNLARIQVVRIR